MKHLLIQAQSEIQSLRRRNEILSAKVEVMDLFAVVLHTAPAYTPQGMSEDVAWRLQREIDLMEATEKKGSPPPGMNHFCRGESGSGEWSCRSTEVPSKCGYCGEPNDALNKIRSEGNE